MTSRIVNKAMPRDTSRSKELFERSKDLMIEGGSSPSRGPANYGDYPIFMAEGRGSKILDVDGNTYVDWMMAYGALPLGHAHPAVVEAVQLGAATGNHFATAIEIELEVAQQIQQMIPGAERVRFANTGTEATMAAIRLARGYTGRPKFIKFEGHYHGWFDDFLVSSHPQLVTSLGYRNDPVPIPDSSGLNRRALEDTIVIPWNDIEALERALCNWQGQVAAVITEGVMANMGVIPPHEGFLPAIRQLTRDHQVLLILDETVTGFRVGPGGCQEHYGVDADVVTLGKGLGAGLPLAAFVGRAEILRALEWGGVLHYGTQNGSRLGLFAARANLRELSRDNGAAFRHLWKIGEALSSGLRQLFERSRTPAIVQNVGPMLQILFTRESSIDDYRQFCAHVDRTAYRRFALALFDHGVYLSPSAALHSVASIAHSVEDVEATLEAIEKVLSVDDP
jgi:glutamate-1-semialdehyde 2,1-aminomutase